MAFEKFLLADSNLYNFPLKTKPNYHYSLNSGHYNSDPNKKIVANQRKEHLKPHL